MSDGLTLSPDFVVMATSTCKYYWFNGEGLPANVHMLAWSRLAECLYHKLVFALEARLVYCYTILLEFIYGVLCHTV